MMRLNPNSKAAGQKKQHNEQKHAKRLVELTTTVALGDNSLSDRRYYFTIINSHKNIYKNIDWCSLYQPQMHQFCCMSSFQTVYCILTKMLI